MTALGLGNVLRDQGEFEAANRFLEATKVSFKALLGPAHTLTMFAHTSLARLRLAEDKQPEADLLVLMVRMAAREGAEAQDALEENLKIMELDARFQGMAWGADDKRIVNARAVMQKLRQ